MSAIHKLSIDTAALFVSRSTNSSPSEREKHDVKRSRSHGSSPLPKRMQMQIVKALARENNLYEKGHLKQASQSPIFSRSSHQESDSRSDNDTERPSQSKGQKDRKVSKNEKDCQYDTDSKPRKKNSLVKNFLVSRLRSGSWHASSDSEVSKDSKVVRRISEDTPSSRERANESVDGAMKSNKNSNLNELIQHVLETHLHNEVYDCSMASDKCKLVSEVLEQTVKCRLNVGSKNFKISALVFLGEVKDDGIKMATQCAWEPNQDHFAMATFESDHLFASAMVFAVEFEDGYDLEKY